MEAGLEPGARSAARAPSTPCSSPASWPSPRTRARRSPCATAPTGSSPIVLLDRVAAARARRGRRRARARPRPADDPRHPRPGVGGARGDPPHARPPRRRRRGPGRGALLGARRRRRRCPRAWSALRATYPMSRYFAAFDGAVAAAGYNAYHELIALGVPSLFVPMPRDTDDQPARARYAEGAGIGLGVTRPGRPRRSRRSSSACSTRPSGARSAAASARSPGRGRRPGRGVAGRARRRPSGENAA